MLTIRTAGRPLAGHLWLITVLACSVLVACDDAPTKAPSAAGTAVKAPKDKTAALPANMVSAVWAGKGASAISVHFALGAAPTVARELPVDIAIVPHRPFTSVSATFEGHESLRMSAGFLFEPRKDAAPETILAHKLMLLPSEDGVFLISVAVETEGDDGSFTRLFSIPIFVHGAAAPAKPVGEAPPPANAAGATG